MYSVVVRDVGSDVANHMEANCPSPCRTYVRCQKADLAFLQQLACTGREKTALRVDLHNVFDGQILAAIDAPPRRGREGRTNVCKAVRAQQ
jgi:hypothetical protein